MGEFRSIINSLELQADDEEFVDYEYINLFKNPSKLPITQIHLEKHTLKPTKNTPPIFSLDNESARKCFEEKVELVPALSKRWLSDTSNYFKYHPYNFTTNTEQTQFARANKLFLQTLHHYLECDYHQFWCLMIFEPKVAVSLHSFLLNPVAPYRIKTLDNEAKSVYSAVFSLFLQVYERLITFQESEYEYMDESVGLKFLLDKKLLNLPLVVTLIMLYEQTNSAFVNDLVSLYFTGSSVFRDKEIEQMLDQVLMTLEMLGGHVCGFEPGAMMVPLSIDAKPPIFSLNWIHSIIDYLLNTISVLHLLLKYHKPATEIALSKGLPYRLSFTYDKLFSRIYEYLNGRQELARGSKSYNIIMEGIALARSNFVEVFNAFVSFCLDRALEFSGDVHRQDEFVEIYLKLMTSSLDDEYFVCDYHERYDIRTQNETFGSFAELDPTRTDYIVNCVESLRRHCKISKALRTQPATLHKTIRKYANDRRIKEELPPLQNGVNAKVSHEEYNDKSSPPTAEEIEQAIKVVVDMFPHLGDGFVLQCLEAYNYNANEVIGAILEENLPPHLVDIPFDTIRIPPEAPPPQPILAYVGRKPDYDDALKLLNDKRDMKQIKTYILEGIQYTNEFDIYDDEYDDRADDTTVVVRDGGSEEVLRFNPNYEDAVSDTSYSENEYDEEGKPIAAARNKNDFCEDPAAIRARREARRREQGSRNVKPVSGNKDVVGKPKGQGQEKNVQQNRHKKSANKSSRANHNRKSGAQWKRNKGMLPS